MIYSLRRGSNTPTVNDLHLYELGWETTGKKLYINDDAGIKRINTIVKLNGLFNNDPDFYAPTYVMANRVLKSKASWTLGQDPFEYISIDGTVTEDSTNLITSGAVSSALTSLQSTINEALNNKSEIGHIHEIDDVTNLRTELNSKLPASLDIPIAELNNHTLREVFEGGNVILNPTFDGNTTNWNVTAGETLSYFNNNALVTYGSLGGTRGINQPSKYNIGDSYYIVTNVKSNQNITQAQFSDTIATVNIIANNFTKVSNIFTAASITLRVYFTVTNLNTVEYEYVYSINRTSLGISSLTVSQMDYWFSAYQKLKDIESIKDKVNSSKIYFQSENPGVPASTDSVWFHI